MHTVNKQTDEFLYHQVVDMITGQIDNGTLRAGDRLPSLRKLSSELNVSIPTVRQAYLELERHGRISARPKSGYFIQPKRQNRLVGIHCRSCQPMEVKCRTLIDQVYDAIHKPGVLPFGIANPCMAMPATKILHRTMKRVMSRAEERTLSYAPTTGEPGLKRQIAYRYLNQGSSVDPEEIIITNGGQEALYLALKIAAKPGDVIAVESPAYHGILELIESLGMLALEIETCPVDGVSLKALKKALDTHSIAACAFSSSINNPLGFVTSDEYRKELVALLENHDVTLIEDDVYGDLVYEQPRGKPAQFFSTKGQVLTCASFSKTVAPGYRIGWLLPGKFLDQAQTSKRALSCSSGLLQQLTLSEFMASGDYDRQLKRLVPVLKYNAERMADAVAASFPPETAISQPKGGSVLWLELPRNVDSGHLFHEAIDHGISIIPGAIFAARNRYRNFIRLSFGHPWSDEIEKGVHLLGKLVTQMANRV